MEKNNKLVYGKVEITVERITPAIAKRILDTQNMNNRHISMKDAYKYAKIMKEGRWKLGEPIMFDEDGILRDGQHRLKAVIVANMPIEFVVEKGLDREIINDLNTGRATTLKNKGEIFLEPNKMEAKMYPIISKAMNFFENHGKFSTVKLNYYPKDIQTFAFNKEFRPVLEKVSQRSNKDLDIFGNRTLALTMEFILRLVDNKKAEKFFEGVCTGKNQTDGMPDYVFREFLLRRKNSKESNSKWGRGGEETLNAAFNVTWEAFMQDKKIYKMPLLYKKDGDMKKLIKTEIYDPENKLAKYYMNK